MTASAARQSQELLPPLPAVRSQVITKDRQNVDTTNDVWRFRASDDGGRLLRIDWPVIAAACIPIVLSARAIQILKLYVAHRLTFSKGQAGAPTILDTGIPGVVTAAWLQNLPSVSSPLVLLGYLALRNGWCSAASARARQAWLYKVSG